MSNVLLAGVKFNWRGAYANNVGYANNDAVGFNNSSFAAIAGVSAVPPMVPIASPTGTRFAVTVSGTTFRFAETRPDGALSSSSLITTSTANPTLNLQRGATYIFDFSNVPSTLPFALRITATSATTGIAGALANNTSVGSSIATFPYIDSNNRQQLHTAANKIITYTVPFEDAAYYSSLVYVSPVNTAAVGTINLVRSTSLGLMSQYWKQIAGSADAENNAGSILTVGAGNTLTRVESSVHNYEFTTQGTSADATWKAPKGKKYQRMQLVAPPVAWDANMYDQTQTNCMPRSRRGHIQGSRMGTWIMPDRRSLKSAGYNYQGGLGYNAMSDQYAAAPYTGNRYNTNLQYCQFDEAGLAPDDYINFTEGNNSFQLLVTARGRVYFVGYNGYGQMGFGDTTNRYVFTRNSMFGDLEGKTVINAQITFDGEASSGNQNTVMLQTAEGELYVAGYNGYGMIGDGTSTSRPHFVRVGESTINRLGKKMTNFVWNGCSDYHAMTIAWNESNELYVWGNNQTGDFGFGDVTNRPTPTRMTTLESTITPNAYPLTIACLRSSITTAATRLVTAILFSDNHIYTAGKSNQGQLGNNSSASTDSYTYVQVTRPAGKLWSQLHGSGGSAGTFYGLTTDGFLYAWGYNGYGQIADSSTTNRLVPTLCSELPAGVQGTITNLWVYGGDSYACVWAKTSTGRWVTWGWYGNGSLMHNRLVSDTWNTTTPPREITMYLPRNGVGLAQVGVRRAYANNMTLSLEYSNGEVFYVGQNNYEGFNPSGGDGTGYSQGTVYYFQYPKQATSFMF